MVMFPVLGQLRRRRVVLASASPRRREILSNAGLCFEVVPAHSAEPLLRALRGPAVPPEDVARELAAGKALEVARRLHTKDLRTPDLVIGADTIVALDGLILEKPVDKADAYSMLSRLSGREHSVFTGVAVVLCSCPDGRLETDIRTFHEETRVTFSELSEEMLQEYIDSGEPMDKAGGYGIQALGGMLVERVQGDFLNVVGFPLNRFCKELASMLPPSGQPGGQPDGHLSVQPSGHLSAQPSSQLAVQPSSHLSVQAIAGPSSHRSDQASVCTSGHLSDQAGAQPSGHLNVQSSIQLSGQSSVELSGHLSVHPSDHLIVQAGVQPSSHLSDQSSAQSSGHISIQSKSQPSSHLRVQSSSHLSDQSNIQLSGHLSVQASAQPSGHLNVQSRGHLSDQFSGHLTDQPGGHLSDQSSAQPSNHLSPSSHLGLQSIGHLTDQPSAVQPSSQHWSLEGAPMSPEALLQLMNSFKASKVLLTACRLGLFETLSRHQCPLPTEHVAERLGLPPDGASRLLDACRGLGLLTTTADPGSETQGYALAPTARLFLAPGAQLSLHGLALVLDTAWHCFTHLEDALRGGHGTLAPGTPASLALDPLTREVTHCSPDTRLRLLLAEHSLSQLTARQVAVAFDLSPFSSACHLGGGTGVLARELALRNPGLRVTVLDLPEVVQRAASFQPDGNPGTSVSFVAGDWLQACPRVDLQVLTWTLPPDPALGLLGRLRARCPPGGGLLLVEGAWPWVAPGCPPALLDQLVSPGNPPCPPGDLHRLLEEVGFRAIHRAQVRGLTLLLATT